MYQLSLSLPILSFFPGLSRSSLSEGQGQLQVMVKFIYRSSSFTGQGQMSYKLFHSLNPVPWTLYVNMNTICKEVTDVLTIIISFV